MRQPKKREYLEKYPTVKKWFESVKRTGRKRTLTAGAKRKRLQFMEDYLTFIHSKDAGLTPDDLIQEAKADLKVAIDRLDDYFNWLRGEQVEDYKPRATKIEWNSACTERGFIRGFYSHNDIAFPKSFREPKRERWSKASKRDEKAPIYGFNPETEEITYNNELLQHFASNLNFRDQSVMLGLLSTGADASDVLALNVGFVKGPKGNITEEKRILWKGLRLKDKQPFKVFWSKEATSFLKQYVEQERANVGDDEPLFVISEYEYTEESGKAVKVGGRMTVQALEHNFRAVAKKMGYTSKGKTNPFRPKRFRHLFRTACGNARIDQGYTMAMMGHASTISAVYLEKAKGLFLREYVRAEPYLTVFGAETVELTTSVQDLEQKVGELDDELAQRNRQNLALMEEQLLQRKELRKMRKTLDLMAPMVEFCKAYPSDVILKAIELVEYVKETPATVKDIKGGEALFQTVKTK